MRSVKIIATGVACSLLDEKLNPRSTVAVSSILTQPPYRKATISKVKCREYGEADPDLVLDRVRLASEMASENEADEVHLDIPIRGLDVLDLNPGVVDLLHLSYHVRKALKDALPQVREMAEKLKQKRGLTIRAFGSRSLPVRIAKLTAASGAVDFAVRRCLERNEMVRIGLPIFATMNLDAENVVVKPRGPDSEYEGVFGSSNDVLKRVTFAEYVNPLFQVFRILEIKPQK
jgi:hypothetical protein